MKTLICIAIIGASLSAQANLKKSSVKNPNSRLSTDIRFSGDTVGGKLQTPFESLTEVENEKDIEDLIGVRKNFSDRRQQMKAMR